MVAPRYPTPEFISVHPMDREYLSRQLPAAQIYGQPVPAGTPIHEDPSVRPGTARIRIDGHTVVAVLGKSETPGTLHWSLPEPYPYPDPFAPLPLEA